MTKKMKFAKWLLLLSGVLIVALGISMLFSPLANLVTLAMLISIAVLFTGISEITAWFNEEKEQRSPMMLVSGILATLFGASMLLGFGTLILATMLPLIFGVWVIVSGVTRIVKSFTKRKEGSKQWVMTLTLGILGTVLGLLLLFYPVLSALIVSVSLAILLIIHGLNSVFLFFGLQRLNKRIQGLRTKTVGRVFGRGGAYNEV